MGSTRSTGNVVRARGQRRGWRAVAQAVLAFALAGSGVVVLTGTAHAATPVTGQVTRGNDTNRTNWYSNEAALSPATVADANAFGNLFDKDLDGQIMAQPLVANGVLVVATENNVVYGLDPNTGQELWSTSGTGRFGTPYDPTQLPNSNTGLKVGCGDLVPNVGITSTPVIDTTTNTIYVVANEVIAGVDQYRMHALNLTTGEERTNLGFPRVLQGVSDNTINGNHITFHADHQTQRPGLLLLNGVVYAAFSAHCQVPNWSGWVMGVNASTGVINARWTDHQASSEATSGGGIWMSGGGLASDADGQILLGIGNAITPNGGAYSRNNPPAELSNAVVRLVVQPDKTLALNDFFIPENENELDADDLDLGSGGVALLPDQYFGTSAIPHLAVTSGKSGVVYLLNRDELGGEQQGPGGTDAVVGKYGPNGGVWAQPSVWPGDGGYVYIPAASPSSQNYGTSGNLVAYKYGIDGNGTPTLSKVATSSEAWGFGSSTVMVTSNGTTSGSALLWAIHSTTGGSGAGVPNAELVAYNAIPTNGDFTKVRQFNIGTANKFTPPAIGPDGQVYAATYDGHLLGYGPTQTSHLTTASVAFPDTTVGLSSTMTATFTATSPTTISNLEVTGPFTKGTSTPALPATLGANQSLTVPVTFSPTTAGAISETITATTPTGTLSATLSGTALSAGPHLAMTPTTLGFGPVAEGVTVSNAITITNTGSATATITSVTPPNAPFSMTGAPAANSTIAPGASKQVTVRFSPVAEGAFTGTVTVASDGGTVSTALTGTGAHPAFVTITPLSNPLGDVTVGTTAIAQFTLTNTGGVPATISVSKPPTGGIFQAQTNLPEGTQIPAGASITKRVAFTPTSTGFQSAVWQITASDGQGPRNVSFSGTGVTGSVAIPNVGGAGWTLRGTAVPSTGGVTLTAATDENAAGSVFYSTPVSTSNFSASFDAKLSGGGQLEGADGLTLTFANPNSPTLLGGQGGGLGFTGITGVAVALDTYQNSVNPSANFVGIGTGALDGDNNLINWLVTNSSPSLPNLRAATVHVDITAKNGVLTMKLNGVQVLSQSVTLPPQALIGFTAGNGSVTDNHIVTNTVITSGAVTPPPPPPTSNGLYRTAIEANTAGLWLAATGGTNLGLGLMPGTSPSITALTGGGYQIAFQSNTGSLWSTGTAGTRNWGLGVKAGTSPSITALAGGGYQIAFQANTGVLWTAGTAGISNLQLGMKAGTNPAITNVPGGYQIAFQANTSALWSTGTAGTRNWGLGMNGTTSPSITGLAGGGYQIAFQANTGSLWTAGTAGIVNWNLGMYAGTNPAISR